MVLPFGTPVEPGELTPALPGYAAAGQAAEAAGVAVQFQVIPQVRVEGGAFKDQANALDLQLVEVGRTVVAAVGGQAGLVVGAVVHFVEVFVRLEPAADAQLEGDLALVVPVGPLGVRGAADDEALVVFVPGLDAVVEVGAGVLLEVVADDLLDVGVGQRLGVVLALAVRVRAGGSDLAAADEVFQFLDPLLLRLELSLNVGRGAGAAAAGAGAAAGGSGCCAWLTPAAANSAAPEKMRYFLSSPQPIPEHDFYLPVGGARGPSPRRLLR